MQLVVVATRGIDPDELEHLHAAYSVFRGQLPYRDFFEHHAPAYYYLLQPLFWWYGPELKVLWSGRILMVGCSLGTVFVIWRLASWLRDTKTAWIAAILLAWSHLFVSKGSELRPDVPACLILSILLDFCLRKMQSNSLWTWIPLGILGGLATLFTQKSIVPVFSILIGLMWARCYRSRTLVSCAHGPHLNNKDRLQTGWGSQVVLAAGFAIGGAIVWGCVGVAFGLSGALSQFVDGTLWQLVRWSVPNDRWERLRPVVAADLTLWAFAAWQIIHVFKESWQRNVCSHSVLLAVTLTSSLASLLVVKAVYPQFPFLWVPLLVLMAALTITDGERFESFPRQLVLIGLCCCLSVLQAWLLIRGLQGLQSSALTHLQGAWSGFGLPAHLILLPLGLLLITVVAVTLQYQRRVPTFILVCLLGMIYGLARDIDTWMWNNQYSVQRIRNVNALVRRDQVVLDGFSGFGALRPHANFYWWINRYSIGLMPKNGEDALVERLKKHPPAVVLLDEDLKSLAKVTSWVYQNYQPTNADPIWIPRIPASVLSNERLIGE